MALITQVLGRVPTPAEIDAKKRNIRAVIDTHKACARAINELVGAAKPDSPSALEKARIDAIVAVMGENPSFAAAVDNAARQ
jgi:hypothetical protein